MVKDLAPGREEDAGGGGRRECRVDGHRFRLWGGVQDRIAQSPQCARALSGCGDGGRRYPPRYLHDGCPADRLVELLTFREYQRSQDAAFAVGGSAWLRALRQLFWGAHGGW